jgi:hypothetical protein
MPSSIYLANGARGFLVSKVQRGVASLGVACDVDGDYGPGTEKAVKAAQVKLGVPATGTVDAATWRGVTKTEPPSLYERCLALTMNFEGHGFNLAAGNWDSAGITWGIIGFTMGSGSLLEVFNRIPFADVSNVFGHTYATQLLTALKNKDKAWADSISLKPNKYKLVEPWHSGFWSLGDLPSAQAAQMAVASEKYWVPSQKRLETYLPLLKSERAAAMSFDCQVNQGGIYKTSIQYAQTALGKGGTEQAALEAIAAGQRDGMNAASREKWGADVYARRLTIAQGVGKVHGKYYELSDYGLNLEVR